jgi:hypothetical protein
MTVKVRSSAGNSNTGSDTTPSFDSPATITAGDLLVLLLEYDDNDAQSITPDTGWSLEDEATSATPGTAGRRFMLYTKTAVASDVTNAGTADYYNFTGGSADDMVYGVLSLYDDAGGTVSYQASSFAANVETGGGSSTTAPTQTVTLNGSMSLSAWSANEGTNPFAIDVGEGYAPTGGANVALIHGTWADTNISNINWVVGTAEWDVGDSPIGTQVLTHNSLSADVDQYSVSMIFEASTTTAPVALYNLRLMDF